MLVSVASAADAPKFFASLFTKDVPVTAQIGIVLPPADFDKYVAKVEAAARLDPKWFKEFSSQAKPGVPLPFNEKLGLSKEEYDEYIKLWAKREFKPTEDVELLLRETPSGAWIIAATGNASCISNLRYDEKADVFHSPNGELKRIDDIKADAESVLGAWTGKEWRYEEETSLGNTKENLAVGCFDDKKYGLLVYRFQEISSEGTRFADKSLAIRFELGKTAHPKVAEPVQASKTKPAATATPKSASKTPAKR